jgi:hypothetical protein
LKVQNGLARNSGRNAADLRAAGPAVAAFVVEGLPLFGVNQMIDLSITDLMDLLAEGVADLVPEAVVNAPGFLHGLSVLRPVFQLFPPHQAAYRHNGSRKCATGFPHSNHSPSQRTSSFEDLFASHLKLFLQSRKNGLGSAEIGHVILEGGLEDLIQQFFPVLHHFFPPLSLTTDGFFKDDKHHSSDHKND